LAYKVASEGIVLLKNENKILPLGRGDKLAIIGNFAKIPRYQGAGSSLVTPTRVENLVDNLEARFAAGYNLMGKTNPGLIKEAKQLAASADKVVVVVGLTFLEESEGFDRTSYGIAPGHQQLLDAVIDSNPNVIVVLQNGSPVAMPWLDRVDGVIETYLGGQAGGRALADVLTGKVNPSGKLAETFPARIEDNPTYIAWAGEEDKTYYNEGIFVGYRYYDRKRIDPLFPFGYGLSYSNFEIDDLSIERSEFTENDTVTVSVTVKNTGKVAGQEVIQLYVRDVESSVSRPEKELKHFAKVLLQPGEKKEVSFQLSNRDFAFYSARHKQWVTESGDFSILVGNSSRNLPLQQQVRLSVISPPKMVFTRYSLLKDVREHPVGKKLIENIMKNLFGGVQPNQANEAMSEQEQVAAMKWANGMKFLINDMPIKNLVKFSKGEMSEDDLGNILAALNQ
jgi:beta-glucosidase